MPDSASPGQGQEFLEWPLQYRNLIMDLGDVFCFWSKSENLSPISAFDLQRIIKTPEWNDYERGKLSKEECFELSKTRFDLKDGDLEQSIKIFADGMQWNENLVCEIRRIKAALQGKLRVFLMTNISQPDFETLEPTIRGWNLFDDIFTSAAMGACKPELAFYRNVVHNIESGAETAVFVDDKHENVCLAQSMGMHGILFESTAQVTHELDVIFRDPLHRANDWIRAHARELWSVTDSGVVIHDQFAQLVMLEMNFLKITENLRHWNTFLGKPVLTDADFPDDFDSTAFALRNLNCPDDLKNGVLDEILAYPRSDGLFATYFDRNRPRFCACVSASVIRNFYLSDRGFEIQDTLERLVQILESGAYRFGTRYYDDPEWFLYYLASLCAENSTAAELDKLRHLLKIHIRSRVGTSFHPCAVGLRILSAQLLELHDDAALDLSFLLKSQDLDGSWTRDAWIWKYGRSGMKASNVGMVTAIAARVIKNAGPDRVKQALRLW